MNKKVAIILGSKSDLQYSDSSKEYFEYFQIDYEVQILSAHRNPDKVHDFAINARKNGYSILIGSAGMAAHLAGALKANSTLPVIGVPLPGGILDGLDSLLSTLQMPKGVPVATMTVGKAGFINAAIFCAEVFSLVDSNISNRLDDFKNNGAKL